MDSTQLIGLPDFELPARSRVVVVAPHPDDETLGLGGLLSMLEKRGCAIALIALTEGEAYDPSASSDLRAQLAVDRGRERQNALRALELSEVRVVRLGLPDGQLDRTPGIAALLSPLVRGADQCFAPFRRDGHPDHDAAGEAAVEACEAAGVRLAEYPIWAWNWARPNSDDLPWSRARRVVLTPEAQKAKSRAVKEYRSQIEPRSDSARAEPIVPARVLAHFAREFEVLFV
jgi:LmbE family N-acetylglucosaminyl deacetylase